MGPLGSNLVLLLVSSLDGHLSGGSSLWRLQFLHLRCVVLKKKKKHSLRVEN